MKDFGQDKLVAMFEKIAISYTHNALTREVKELKNNSPLIYRLLLLAPSRAEIKRHNQLFSQHLISCWLQLLKRQLKKTDLIDLSPELLPLELDKENIKIWERSYYSFSLLTLEEKKMLWRIFNKEIFKESDEIYLPINAKIIKVKKDDISYQFFMIPM